MVVRLFSRWLLYIEFTLDTVLFKYDFFLDLELKTAPDA